MKLPKYIKWLFLAGCALSALGFIINKTEITQTGIIILSTITVGLWVIESIKDKQ